MVAMEIILRSKNCDGTATAGIMASAFAIIGCIVLAGLIVVIFVKFGQVMSDRRAYAKFVKEANESKKQMQELNPLYISPITEFRLPDSFPRDKND